MFLFSLLLGKNRGRDKAARRFSMLLYILHPWSIVLVRFGARLVGLEGLFIANSLGHFAAVLALTALWAWALTALWPQKRDPHGRAWQEVDLEAIAHNAAVLRAAAGENVTDFLKNTLCRDVLDQKVLEKYLVMSREANVFDVFEAFETHKGIYAVIVTENGVLGEKALLLITPSDFPLINRFLETYCAKAF